MTVKGKPHRRKIAVVTVARSDFGIYLPILRKLSDSTWGEPLLIAAAAHLSDRHGRTIQWIEREGFSVSAEVPTSDDTQSPLGVGRSCGQAVAGFAEAIAALQPDMLMLLGDRFEMHAAAVAAVPFALPIIHLHGGETTEGAIDECYRHSLTKMSHVHFASTRAYADRILQMGEDPKRVFVSGAPGLDTLAQTDRLSWSELQERIGIQLDHSPLAVTFHPETISDLTPRQQLLPLLAALANTTRPLVISRPNADPGNETITAMLGEFVAPRSSRAVLLANLGSPAYFSLLHHAAAMVGNSSSGIIEAASFGLPVVNIGDRQKGRLRAHNVIDVPCCQSAIESALNWACDPKTRGSLQGMANPYGDGRASQRIVSALASLDCCPSLIKKTFFDHPESTFTNHSKAA